MQKDAKELMNKKKYYMLSHFGAVPWGREKKKKRRQRGDAGSRGGGCSPALRSMTPSLPTPCSCQNPPMSNTTWALPPARHCYKKKKKKKQQVKVHPICSASTEETEAISSSKRVTKLPFPKPVREREQGKAGGMQNIPMPSEHRGSVRRPTPAR